MMSTQGSSKAILYALCANLGIAIAKVFAATISGSGSMSAEAIHSFADCGNQILLLFGQKRSKRPPNAKYPLGYGRSIYFWSFLVAVLLFFVGGLFSVYEGFHKLHNQGTMQYPAVVIGVLIFSIILESLSMRACMQEIEPYRNGGSWYRWFQDSRRSELVVVFGEDLAALMGLIFALIAVLCTLLTGNPIYDAMGSIVIGLLLLIVAVMVGIKIKGLLIGQSAEEEIQQQINDFLNGREEIVKILNVITLQQGDNVMVAIKAQMGQDSAAEMVAAINRVEVDLQRTVPCVEWVFFEPDITD